MRASFVLTRTMSCHGFQTRTAFRREWCLSDGDLSTRADFVSWRRFAGRVSSRHVAVVFQRLFDARGKIPLTTITLSRHLSARGFLTLASCAFRRRFDACAHCPRTSFARAWRFASRVFYPHAAIFRLRPSSARVLWPLVRSTISVDPPTPSVPPSCGGDESDSRGNLPLRAPLAARASSKPRVRQKSSARAAI